VEVVGRLAVGLGCSALLFIGGVMAGFAGEITCHEDAGSGDRAPTFCATVGSHPTVWLPAILAPACILVLLIASAGRRTIARTSVVVVTVEGALFTMWALVSQGTIRW
jgi:hypothetical protein